MVHKNYLNAEQFERYKQFIYAGSIGEAKKMLLEIIPKDCMIYKYYRGIVKKYMIPKRSILLQ